jgi:hypothetical protein
MAVPEASGIGTADIGFGLATFELWARAKGAKLTSVITEAYRSFRIETFISPPS